MSIALVIEDTDEMRDLLGAMLKRMGFEVEQAKNGLEGIKLAQALHPSLIILDLMMPLAAGDMALGFLRSTEGLKEIPVIVTSAHPKARDIAMQLGAQACLPKPFDMQELRQIIQDLHPLS